MKKTHKNINGSSRKYGKILEINVISTTVTSVLTGVEGYISHNRRSSTSKRKFSILTPNPEIVSLAQDNYMLKEALNSCDFPVPDGIGLSYASKFLYGKPLNIIPGRKLCLDLIELSAKKDWKVFLLGGRGDEAAVAAEKLRAKYPRLKIKSDKGPKVDNNATPVTKVDVNTQKDVVDRINRFGPEILFVAFGNPKQEIWIHKHLSKLNISGAMAVGGAFRYIAGISPIPPEYMEAAGMEWLWRLITEPYRAGRIFRAIVLFPLKVLASKLMNNG